MMKFCNFKALGPSWKVKLYCGVSGAQREFFARKKPCPPQANFGFITQQLRRNDPVTFEKGKRNG